MEKALAAQLGSNHRRGISTTLAFLDEAICEFEQWAKGRAMKSVFYEEYNTLTSQQRRDLLSEIAGIRAVLQQVKEKLKLEGTSRNAVQAIWSRSSNLREHLIELTGKHLRRYGKVPAALTEYLDPCLDDLLDRMDRLVAIVCVAPQSAERE
ncbi:MAG: hypothetical protein ACUVX8_05235 [Candidatus Zipacnadales bacterium]